MKRFQFVPAFFRCNFAGCGKPIKTPGGLTRHKQSCKFNPGNQYRFSTPPSSPPFVPHTPSPPPGPDNGLLPPQTPNRVPNLGTPTPPTPSQSTSRRTVWTTQGRTGIYTRQHEILNGRRCDKEGNFLPPGAPPPPKPAADNDDFFPFTSGTEFKVGTLLYRKAQMSNGDVNTLMELWAEYQALKGEEVDPPFAHTKDLHDAIDSIPLGDVPWQAFKVKYNGEIPEKAPGWMTKEYEVWYQDPLCVMEMQIGNPNFDGEIDYAPKEVYGRNGRRQFTDLMSGQWAWNEADTIARDCLEAEGAMLAPVVLGSDKTTVSVATGQNDYYPLYGSLGSAQNHVRRAHRNAVSVIGFLAIPKTDREEQDSAEFRKFRRQLFHSSLTHILSPLKPWMEKPRVTLCGDGYYRRVIYSLGPYIADYPEQCLLACIVSGWCPRCTAFSGDLDGDPDKAIQQSHEHTDALFEAFGGDMKDMWDGYGIIGDIEPFTANFPRADIHVLLSPDLLHEVIKGTFKDHLVTWVSDYLYAVYEKAEAKRILAEIDRRIAVAPPFPGLRRFPEGRGFKQWTGDDSKALMKAILPAIAGLVPPQMVRAIGAFMEFCYLVRQSQIDKTVLCQIDDAVRHFHNEHVIFLQAGVREDFNLPRQHSITHYRWLIQQFGAPNGLCSSITESKHIKAVKQPWRRLNRNKALGQMLLTNQHLDKLEAAAVDFKLRGMLDYNVFEERAESARLPIHNAGEDDDEDVAGLTSLGDVQFPKRPACHYPRLLDELSGFLGLPTLNEYIRRFLYDQLNPESDVFGMDVPLDDCPKISSSLWANVYHSAAATFHAPSDLSGIGGMHREHIRATPSWQHGAPRYDCVYVEKDPDADGFRGLDVAQVELFFSFTYDSVSYPCALVRWFVPHGESPCKDTGMWMVKPDFNTRRRRVSSVIHIDTILRSAHLSGVAGDQFILRTLTHSQSLQAFRLFYVNKYADHHAHEIGY
ncbi:hypothetical protein B0H34DRAFT_855228 [Crassisporium funariophilum]|nr:hypothetical protein B0H34DRAFT_855228 [Crassisporium funariophilum]